MIVYCSLINLHKGGDLDGLVFVRRLVVFRALIFKTALPTVSFLPNIISVMFGNFL